MRRICGLLLAVAATLAAEGRPGVFDFYLLSLSWSPQYCSGPAGQRDAFQCGGGRRFGFVVHGLWPQYERGYPENCAPASPVDRATIGRMLPLMPSARLIQHEWDKHGTCSGLSQSAYFETIERVFASFKVPAGYRAPASSVYVRPAAIKRDFHAANPPLAEAAVKVQCRGRFLSEVRICLSRDLSPRPCPAVVRDACPGGDIIMQPVR